MRENDTACAMRTLRLLRVVRHMPAHQQVVAAHDVAEEINTVAHRPQTLAFGVLQS